MWDYEKNVLITSDNKKKKVHYINLLKLIPKVKENKKFEFRQSYIKTRNIKYFDFPKLKNREKCENEEANSLNKISQIILNSPNKNLNNSFSVSKLHTKQYLKDIQFTNHKIANQNKTNKAYKNNLKKDSILAFFNRNFYENDVQISKKTELNQKILNYYLKDKEYRDKIQQQKLEDLMKKNNKYEAQKLKMKILNEKKNDIKNSLILNDFRIYNRIQKVVRFWGKFTNYACPIFQVKKFSFENQKYNNNKNNFSFENINQNNSNEKKFNKLPVLYTNSSRTIDNLSDKKLKLLGKNKSDLDIDELNAFKNKSKL